LIRRNRDYARFGVFATPRFVLADSSHVVRGFLDRNDLRVPRGTKCG
jgi:hypothetical protein